MKFTRLTFLGGGERGLLALNPLTIRGKYNSLMRML